MRKKVADFRKEPSLSVPQEQYLALANVIDIDAEKNRLVKTNEKLIKEISSMEGRLNNPKFVKSAPPEVVNETRENLEKRKEEEAQITNALKRLEEI